MLQIGKPLQNDCEVGKGWYVLKETEEWGLEDIVIDQVNAKRKAQEFSSEKVVSVLKYQ